MSTLRVICFLAIALLTVLACAQDTTAPSTDGAAAPTVDVQGSSLGVSAISINVDGNEKRFEQYATPPDGLVPGFNFTSLWPSGQSLLLNAPYLDENFQQGSLWLLGSPATMAVGADLLTTQYFNDFTAAGQPINRKAMVADGLVRFGNGTFLVTDRELHLSTPGRLSANDWEVSRPGVDYILPIGNSLVGAGYAHESFNFRDGAKFSGDDQILRFRFAPLTSARTAIDATATLTNTYLDGNPGTPSRMQVNLHGTRVLTPVLSLDGVLTHENLFDAIARNGYAKNDLHGQVKADYTGIASTRVTLGVGSREVGYVNDPQTLRYDTRVRNYFLGVTARPAKTVRIKAGLDRAVASGLPVEVTVLDEPLGTSVLWSQRDRQQVEVSYTPLARLGLSAGWQRYAWQNEDFATESSFIDRSLNAWWLPRDNVTVYATYLVQTYGLLGVNTTDGLSSTDDRSLVTGVTVQVSPVLSLDASLTNIDAEGRVDSNRKILGFGADLALKGNGSLSLRFATDDLTTAQNAPTEDYDAGFAELRYNRSF
jgi:hypothetical protein